MPAPAPGGEMRLFVGIALPDFVKDRLSEYTFALGRCAEGKFVRPQLLHITLSFLGNTPPDRVPYVIEAMEGAAEGFPPFELGLGPFGWFGKKEAPRVGYAGLKGDVQSLFRLQGRLGQGLLDQGFEIQDQRFAPHITLARQMRFAKGLPPPVPGLGFSVEKITVFHSFRPGAGLVYLPVGEVALDG